MNSMLRQCRGDRLRTGAWLVAGLALAHCTDPKFRDLDASEMQRELSDAAQQALPDGAVPGSDAGDQVHRGPDGGLDDAESAALEARMQSMVGKYFMRLYFNTQDGSSRPIVKGLSTVEIRKSASGLELEEQGCYQWGTAMVLLATALTEFDASLTPRKVYQLAYNGKTFDAMQSGNATLGYDATLPSGCASAKTVPTTMQEKPWLKGADCSCPNNLSELPPKGYTDCRINDDDHDDSPGVTVVARIEGFDPLDMYLVQRSRDQYLNLDYKGSQQNKVLLGNFYTTRTASLLGCPPPEGPNCTIVNLPACHWKYSTVELVRLSGEQTFSCQGLYEADAIEGVFNELPPANCE